jgi:hypothetical protein
VTLGVAADLFLASRSWQDAATGEPIGHGDHRPRPIATGGPGLSARLVDFAPNRLVYRVRAERPGRIVLPLRHREGVDCWRVQGADPGSEGGRLALGLPSGEGEASLVYRPRGLGAGIALSVATSAALAAWLLRRRART